MGEVATPGGDAHRDGDHVGEEEDIDDDSHRDDERVGDEEVNKEEGEDNGDSEHKSGFSDNCDKENAKENICNDDCYVFSQC